MIRTNDPVLLPMVAVGTLTAGGFALTQAAGDLAIFTIPYKCQLIRSQVVIQVSPAGDTTFGAASFDKRITAGSDTGRMADVGGVFDFAGMAAAPAPGKVIYFQPQSQVIFMPGEQVVFELVTPAAGVGAAGNAVPQLLVSELPETPANITAMTNVAFA